MKVLGLFFFLGLMNVLHCQIKSGPMLGYNTMKEVLVWIQTEEPAVVEMMYYSTSEHKAKIYKTKVESKEDGGNTAHIVAENLEPGTTYKYLISIGENKNIAEGTFTTQSLWQHREEPPVFSFATGSCAYINQKKYDRPGEGYGSGYEIFENIASTDAEFMLWLGDNIYLREPDWSSKSGIYQRYSHFKSLAELQNLWGNMHHYAIWDDHDFGPNDADRSFINKEITLQAFKDFWGNQAYGVDEEKGITHQFSYNDLDFFLLDNRYHRSPNKRKTGDREILGSEQIEWLIDGLVNSKATFKIVAIGGQFLSPAAVHENYATFNEERLKVIKLIEKEEIKNIVFLTGDRHKTELTKMELSNGNVIYDYTCSPLTSKAYDTNDEGNTLRLEGTHVSTQNFGLLDLKGSFEDRILTIQTFDSSGKLLWKKEIKKQ